MGVTVPKFCPSGDIFLVEDIFFNFWNMVEVMLTLVSLDNCKISVLKCAKVRNLRAEHFESYSSFSYCTHSTTYIGCCPVTGTSFAYKLIIFRPSTTDTLPLNYSNFAYSYKMVRKLTKNKQKYATHSLNYSYCY